MIISWVCDCVTAVCSKAFIRVLDREVEKKVLLQCHMIDGRLCDIKIPDKKKRERKLNTSQSTEEKWIMAKTPPGQWPPILTVLIFVFVKSTPPCLEIKIGKQFKREDMCFRRTFLLVGS